MDKGFLVLREYPGCGTVLAMADLRTRGGDEVTIEYVEAKAQHWTVVLSKGHSSPTSRPHYRSHGRGASLI
ncbi:hypothetical protein M2275_008222 [Rhodococcus opacus]|nr:hypothetical protein [Rhodococcus opacus]